MIIGGVGNQASGAQITFDLEGGQYEVVRCGTLRGVGAHISVAAGIGVQRPVTLDVVAVPILVIDARGDLDLIGDGPHGSQAEQHGLIVVGVLLVGFKRGFRIDSIDVTAVAPVPDRDARAQGAVHQRAARGDARFVAGCSTFGVGNLIAAVEAGLGQARLGGDVADRAAFGARAEQGALRSAQNLDPVDVEGLRQCLVGIEGERSHLNRRVIQVDAGGAGASGGRDTANRYVVRSGVVDVDARREARDVDDVLDTAHIHGILSEGGHAHRDFAQVFLVACRGDDDLLERADLR